MISVRQCVVLADLISRRRAAPDGCTDSDIIFFFHVIVLVNEATKANFTVVFVDRQSYRRGYDSKGYLALWTDKSLNSLCGSLCRFGESPGMAAFVDGLIGSCAS
jgi:hypothetical protein